MHKKISGFLLGICLLTQALKLPLNKLPLRGCAHAIISLCIRCVEKNMYSTAYAHARMLSIHYELILRVTFAFSWDLWALRETWIHARISMQEYAQTALLLCKLRCDKSPWADHDDEHDDAVRIQIPCHVFRKCTVRFIEQRHGSRQTKSSQQLFAGATNRTTHV